MNGHTRQEPGATQPPSPEERQHSLLPPALRWRGLTLQLFLFVFLPLTVLLLVIAFGSLSLHHESMRTLVGDRDLRAVRAASISLTRELEYRAINLRLLAAQVEASPDPATLLSTVVLPGFEGSLALVDGAGQVQAGSLPLPEEAAAALEPPDAAAPAPNGARFSRPVRRADGEWLLVVYAPAGPNRWLAGTFLPAGLARATLGGVTTPETNLVLVAPGGIVLYQAGHFDVTRPVADLPGVYEVLRGESGVNYTQGSQHNGMQGHEGEHLVAFSPVAPLGWGLVIEEPWESSAGPLLQATQFAPLLLAPVLILAMLALWFGARQVVQPLQALERRAARLAAGDFAAIQSTVGGISEIRRLQDALAEMAADLQAAQAALHGYIGALTTAVEAERRALARELHDDTLQSLIALNQQVQLYQLQLAQAAQLEARPEQRQPLTDLQARIGQAITNLRRAIGGLRPIYLEDLGLNAALGMLAKAAESVPDRPPVRYELHGSERRLPSEVELAFYRIAQEALNNAAHHAQAQQVRLGLAFEPGGSVTLHVSDDGRGFTVPDDPNAFARHGHFGLLGMRERAELVGAAFSIQSAPGHGTTIKVRLDSSAGLK